MEGLISNHVAVVVMFTLSILTSVKGCMLGVNLKMVMAIVLSALEKSSYGLLRLLFVWRTDRA